MAETTVRKVSSIAELQRSDVVRHKATGMTCVVDANYGKYAIGITHQHISNPEEWELVVTGVRHKEQLEESHLVPEGDYTLLITKVEVREGGRGSRLCLKCIIVGAESPFMRDVLVGKTMHHSFMISERVWPFIEKLFKACNFEPPGLTQAIACAAELKDHTFDCTIRSDGQYNLVADERPVPAERGPYR